MNCKVTISWFVCSYHTNYCKNPCRMHWIGGKLCLPFKLGEVQSSSHIRKLISLSIWFVCNAVCVGYACSCSIICNNRISIRRLKWSIRWSTNIAMIMFRKLLLLFIIKSCTIHRQLDWYCSFVGCFVSPSVLIFVAPV